MSTNLAHVGEDRSISRALAPGELQAMTTTELFHRLWTRAVGQPGYDKGAWRAFRMAPRRADLLALREVARGQEGFAEEEWAEFLERSLLGTAL